MELLIFLKFYSPFFSFFLQLFQFLFSSLPFVLESFFKFFAVSSYLIVRGWKVNWDSICSDGAWKLMSFTEE